MEDIEPYIRISRSTPTSIKYKKYFILYAYLSAGLVNEENYDRLWDEMMSFSPAPQPQDLD